MSTFDTQQFISDCRDALREGTPERAMREVVARAVAAPADILAALGDPARADFFERLRSEWDPETLLERPFDVQKAQRLFEEANRRSG